MPLAEANINVDMIIQVVSDDFARRPTSLSPSRRPSSSAPAQFWKRPRTRSAFPALQASTDVVKVSAIGVGMRSHAGVAAAAFRALSEKGINIRAITTSEIKFSVLIDAAYTELAVRTLHSLYGLDKA